MHVLIITPRYDEVSGGDGLYAYNLAVGIASCGAQVSVLTIEDDNFVLLTSWKDREKKKETLGAVGSNLLTLNYYSRTARKAVEKAVKLIRPDVIHIQGIHQYFTLSTALYLKNVDIPVVLSVHDYKALCGNAGFFSDRTEDVCLKCISGKTMPPIMERCKKNSRILSCSASVQMTLWKTLKGLDAIDSFHCGSEFVYQLLGNNPWTREKRVKIRLPYLKLIDDPSKIAHSDSIRIVYSGRMVPHKGPTIFARAIKGIENVPIHIFGNGRLFSEMQKLIKENKNVMLHGWKTHEEIHKQLGPGTVVVVPYLAHETFCYVVLEAMMVGCCVIASSRGAIPELIQNNKNGILIQDPTAHNFNDAIVNLMKDPDLVYRLGRTAMTIAQELPSLSVHVNEMIQLYEKLIKR
jgi:glycosyltransferase involved in cell wall biosynthesis